MRIHIPPSLKNRRFFFLWLGLLISIAGSQMQITALFWHIRVLTGNPNPLALGAVGLARILPIIVFSFISGSVADTLNRRTILFITQTLLTLIALALTLADLYRDDPALAHLRFDRPASGCHCL